jgi:hypothetical protein
VEPLDEKLRRAEALFLGDLREDVDELNALLPSLIEAGYVEEKPWGDDPGWFLWSFTEAGRRRSRELEAV